MAERRTRRVRVRRTSTEDRLAGRKEHSHESDEVLSATAVELVGQEVEPTDEVPIIGSQRATRAERVLENYPNMDSNPITEIMLRMEVGDTLTFIITRYSGNEWRALVGEHVPRITNKSAFEGRLPRNFEKDVILSKKFVEWSKEWNKKDNTFEKKKAFAAENNIEWDSDHPDIMVQKKNLGYAVRIWLKIDKYQPAYSGPDGRVARVQARKLAKIGPKK